MVRAGGLLLLGLSVACGSGASLGESCASTSDCATHLQCVYDSCAPRCTNHVECGDGFVCEDTGECTAIVSAVGDACMREIDCGPRQSCQLDNADHDNDGFAAGVCRTAMVGDAVGSQCSADTDCRTGVCSIGLCTALCTTRNDCAPDLSCVEMPVMTAGDGLKFRGCLQSEGTIRLDIPASKSFEDEIEVPVPSNARSFAMVASIDDESQLVGAAKVLSPLGELLYSTPNSVEEYYDNPLRYSPGLGISTMLLPNTPEIQLRTGIYRFEVGSFHATGGLGNQVPKISIIYNLGTGHRLDLNFYFLRLEDHPCAEQIGGVLSATTAPGSTLFQETYLGGLRDMINGANAGIEIGHVTYTDIGGRPDLDGLAFDGLPTLLKQSTPNTGVHIFFVRSIFPAGVQALSGGPPGPPGIVKTAASGIAVSADTLCYRDWSRVARVTAHEIGLHLGLFRNREPDNHLDPIDDSDASSENMMFFSEFGGTELSEGQKQILRLYPGLR